MAILDSEKLDFLWKKIIFGVTKTAGSLVKFGSNETIASPAPVLPSSVWTQGDQVPAEPSDVAVLQACTGTNRIRMTADPTAPANVAWIATAEYESLESRLPNFVPPTFGSGYAVKVFIGDPDGGPAARIFPDTTGEEWVFDYSAGVLIFPTGVPANKAATIGSGAVGVGSAGIYIEAYRYVGETGVGGGALADLADVSADPAPDNGDVLIFQDGVWTPQPLGGAGGLGSMAQQNADSIDVTGGKLDGVTLTNVTIDGGTF